MQSIDDQIKILSQYNNSEQQTAFYQFVKNWVAGEYTDTPKIAESVKCLHYLSQFYPKENTINDESKINNICKIFKNLGIHKHFSQVASHRYWIQQVYKMLIICGCISETELPQINIDRHDLSKYSFNEAIGYSLMFICKSTSQDLSEKQKKIWDASLQSHFKNNPHHPQHADQLKQYKYLLESIIDMLACKLERDYTNKTIIYAQEYFDISDKFTERYTLKDKIRVNELLKEWKHQVSFNIFITNQNLRIWQKSINKIFY